MVPEARQAGVKLWQLILEGYDQLDLDLFEANGLPVANTPGQFSARALAEHALMLMLCAIKGFTRSQRDLEAGVFYRSFGHELYGLTLGLIGTGAQWPRPRPTLPTIWATRQWHQPGRTCCRRGRSLRHQGPGRSGKVDKLLSMADVVSIHVPLAPDTRHMVGSAAFGKMKPSAILINVSRGQIVDQAALLDALRSQRIAGAGLDVFAEEPLPLDDPLLTLGNVVLTPHVAGTTYETSRRRGAAAADKLQRVSRGGKPLYVVT